MTLRWVPHDDKEKEKLSRIDQEKDEEEKLKPCQREGGQPAKESIGAEGKTEHFSGKRKAGTKLAVAGV